MPRAFSSLVVALLIAPLVVALPARADQCNTIKDDGQRLACWDATFPPPADAVKPPPAEDSSKSPSIPENGPIGPWYVQTETDALTDAKNVFLGTPSLEKVPGRFGSNDYARLLISCRDNKTSFVIYFGGAFMSSSEYDNYGEVRYRVDSKKPGRKTFDESTSHEHLGLWSGGASIPVIKELLGGKRLVVAATPYSENPLQLEFDISRIDEAIGPVRTTCGW